MNYDDLNDEIKAKLKGCETPEELLALAKEEGYELSEEELEGVSGGWGALCECNYKDCEVYTYLHGCE